MSEKKLTQEELHHPLEWFLQGWHDYTHGKWEHEMFLPCHGDQKDCESALRIIKERIKQKPTVTRKWINDLAEECFNAIDMGFGCESIIEKAIKERGIKVEK